MAWFGCGLMTGYLAFVQIGYAGSILDDGSLTALAAWNGLMAAVVIYGGVRMLSATQRSSFRQSAIWSIVIALVQGFQIAQGATHFAYIGATVAAIAAGILSYLAYQAILRAETPVNRLRTPPAVVSPRGPAISPTVVSHREPVRPTAGRVVMVAIAVFAVVAVLLVYKSVSSGFSASTLGGSPAPSISATETRLPSLVAAADPADRLMIGSPYTLTSLDPTLETSFRQQFASSAGAFGSLVGIGGREVVQNGSLAGYVIVIGFPAGILSDAAYQSMLTGIESSSTIAFNKTTVSGVEVSSGATSNAGMSVFRSGDNVNLTITPTEASLTAVTTALVTANH